MFFGLLNYLKGYPKLWRKRKIWSYRRRPYGCMVFWEMPCWPFTTGVGDTGLCGDLLPSPSEVLDAMEKAIENALTMRSKDGRRVEHTDEGFAKNYPYLAAHLMVVKLSGGKQRQTSTLSLWCDGDGYHACVNDRHNGCKLYVTVAMLVDLWDVLEQALASPDAAWRPDAKGKGK